MKISAAEVFRTRQVIADLKAFVRNTPEKTMERLAIGLPGFSPGVPDRGDLYRLVYKQDCQFRPSAEVDTYAAVLLAAAFPEEDFPVFILATAILLADLLQATSTPDNLFWNWETYRDHYAIADPDARAVIHNGFRTGHRIGVVKLDPEPKESLCLRSKRTEVLSGLEGTGQTGLARALDADADSAGGLWALASQQSLSAPTAMAFRYLIERNAGMAPPEPETAALIPWLS